MKKMWKKVIRIICVGGLSVMCLTGCGGDVSDNPKIPTNEADDRETNSMNGSDDGVADMNEPDDGAADNVETGFDDANLEGSVVKFSETGFTLSPATTKTEEGGGKVMEEIAVPDPEDENNIQITYTDNTVFQIVNLNMSSQSEVSREDADKESVKKQSSVCVFGSCQDSHHWTADKILILRWQ